MFLWAAFFLLLGIFGGGGVAQQVNPFLSPFSAKVLDFHPPPPPLSPFSVEEEEEEESFLVFAFPEYQHKSLYYQFPHLYLRGGPEAQKYWPARVVISALY